MIVRFASIAVAVGLLAIATPAAAQKFEFGKAEEVEKVEVVDWTAVAEAGLVVTTGNSETTTATGTAKASRLDKWNKLALELGFAYARSSVLFVSDDNLDGAISEDEIDETESTTAKSWNAKIRYDRFLTAHNSLYVAALAAADEPAGEGISVEVIDPRTLVPLDVDTIAASVAKTGRCLVLHEATLTSGFGAELSAVVQERCFYELEAPIVRVAGWDTPYPHALEWDYFPGPDRVGRALRELVGS